jgi:hypothetical protein
VQAVGAVRRRDQSGRHDKVRPVLARIPSRPFRWRVMTLFAGAWLVAGCGAERPLSLAPLRGGQAGGQPVRIEGEGFLGRGPLSIYFGVRSAKAVVIESPWLVTVLAPQTEEPGTVDVTLRFGDGTQQVLPQAYTYDEQPGVVLQPRIGG